MMRVIPTSIQNKLISTPNFSIDIIVRDVKVSILNEERS